MKKPVFEELEKPYKFVQIAIRKDRFDIRKREDEEYYYFDIPTKRALRFAEDIMIVKDSKDFDFESE